MPTPTQPGDTTDPPMGGTVDFIGHGVTCADSAIDHRCDEMPHDDQGVTWREWESILLAQRNYWHRVAQRAAEALALADEYLDGFVWLEDPERAELSAITRASKRAQHRAAGPIQGPSEVSRKALDIVRAAHTPRGVS